MRHALLALSLVLAAAGLARADDASDAKDEAAEPKPAREDPCTNLASHRGLTGMREMIDARTPEGDWRVRAGAYFQGSATQTGVDGDVRTSTRERYELTPYFGASFLGHLEVGVRWPFPEVEHTVNRLHDLAAPTPDPWPSKHDDELFGGGGNPSFAAKAGWTLGPVSLAAYAIGQANAGSRLMAHKEDSFGELGGATTISFAGGLFAAHLDLSGVHLETRHLGWEFRFRTGFSFVVVASDAAVIRTFLYGDGLEAEGGRGCDYSLGAGVQLQLGDHFQAEITGDGRLLAGQLQRPFHDEGTFAVAGGAGFVY